MRCILLNNKQQMAWVNKFMTNFVWDVKDSIGTSNFSLLKWWLNIIAYKEHIFVQGWNENEIPYNAFNNLIANKSFNAIK